MIDRATRVRPARVPRRERVRAAPPPPSPPEELPPKLGHSIREMFATVASVVHTRIALAGVELEEEIQRLIRAAIFGGIASVLSLLALVVATFTIVLAVPPEYRVWTMIAIVVVYLGIAAVLGMRIKAIFTMRPPIFGATFAELEKDKETLTQMVRAHRMAGAMKEPDGDAHATRSEDAFAHPPAAATSTSSVHRSTSTQGT